MEIQATRTKYDIGDVVFYMHENSVKQGVVLTVRYTKERTILFLDDGDICTLSEVEAIKNNQPPYERVVYVVAMCQKTGTNVTYLKERTTTLSESQMFNTKEDLLKSL